MARDTRKFKCVRNWARNRVGDIVEHYEYARYPKEIRDRHFVLIEDKPVAKTSTAKKTSTNTVKESGE